MANRPPHVLSQLDPTTDPSAIGRRSDCGETAEAMILQAGGLPDSPADVIRELGHDGVTNEGELLGLLLHRGASEVYAGPDFRAFKGFVGVGDTYGLALIHDDNSANPDVNGPNLHWIDPYRVNADGTTQCCNPWPDSTGHGRDVAYADSVLSRAFVWGAVVRWPAVVVVNPKPTNGQPVHTATMEDEMGVFGPGWTGKRPQRDDGESFWFDPDGTVWHGYENGGARQPNQPENLGAPPAAGAFTVLGITALHTGLPSPSYTEVRVLVRDTSGLRVFSRALPWAGGTTGDWVTTG
jgi:hypothetical protein